MTALMPPGKEIGQADVTRPGGRSRYVVSPGGTVTPRSSHDERVLRESGWTTQGIGLAVASSAGRRCVECGFAAFFTTCGRCGGECRKEAAGCPPSTAAAT
jgi:hypothetical protein